MGHTDEPVVTVTPHPKGFEAVARQGDHVGWAIQKTEGLARSKALVRLTADREGWFR